MSYDFKKSIAVIDNGYCLYYFDKVTFEHLRHTQLSTKYSLRHKLEKSISISSKFNIFLTTPNSPKSFLIDAETATKLLSEIENHGTPQTVSRFCDDGTLLGVGDESGMCIIYAIPKTRVIATLKKRPDFISSIVFSNDNRFLAVSCFDKTTLLYDFEICKECKIFQTDGVVEDVVFSDDNLELYCADRAKKIYRYNINDNKLSSSIDTILEWPTVLANMGERFLLVGSKDNILYLINKKDLSIQQKLEFNSFGIGALKMIDHLLFVGFSDGEINIINTTRNEKEFQIAISLNKFEEATNHISSNVFLVTNDDYGKYDDAWPEYLMKAKDLIAKGQKIAAIKAVRPFFIDKNKEEEFKSCLGNAKHLAIFQKLVLDKEYVKAMQVADEKEFLKKTDEFRLVENSWYRTFQTAKEVVYEEGPSGVDHAREMLQKYSVVKSKKQLIEHFLENFQLYIDADRHVKQKNFADYFLLVQANPFLQAEEIYRRIVMLGTQTFDKMKKNEYEENIDDAIKIGEYLRVFLPMKESVEKELIVLYQKREMITRLATDNAVAIYELVSKFPLLEGFRSFRIFHSRFVKKKQSATEHANYGNVLQCLDCFAGYFDVPYLAQAIYNTVKNAYITDIEKAISDDIMSLRIDWKLTYIYANEILGSTNELLSLYKKYHQESKIELTNIKEQETFDPLIKLPQTLLKYLK